MEWVETTGRTVEEAKDQALDRLGVDAAEAEFEVVEEAKAGLFGRVRREARVRARVRPTQPRPKVERRDRRRNGRRNGGAGGGSGRQGSSGGAKTAKATKAADQASASADQSEAVATKAPERPTASTRRGGGADGPASSKGGRRGGSGGSARSPEGDRAGAEAGETDDRQPATESAGPSAGPTDRDARGADMSEAVTLEQQGDMVEAFLDGLLDAFDLDGEVTRELIDDEMLEIRVEGDDLGLLIGPKGQTLSALQELSRTVVQRQALGGHQGRFRLDVSGYRQRRREALERFTRSVADEVKASGLAKALEPMASADRKVVHDTVNEIDGVNTVSEGEEPRRCVVIVPE
jgi:spoIIIJ-associated protein